MAQNPPVELSARETAPSATVVSAVAEATGEDPLSMEPLGGVIDPDALDALFGPEAPGVDGTPCRIEFGYCGCEVVVSGNGTVQVSP